MSGFKVKSGEKPTAQNRARFGRARPYLREPEPDLSIDSSIRNVLLSYQLIVEKFPLETVANWGSRRNSGLNSSKFVVKKKALSKQHWQKISSECVDEICSYQKIQKIHI